ncbi:MAG: Fe(3+) dicitrate ABC transporter substrate-binding protein [Pseudomonadota bacterium]
MPLNRRLILPLILATTLGAHMAVSADISHEMGTTAVPADPERVVVLEFSFIDALVSVGMVPVGIADDNNPDRVMTVYGDILGDAWTSVGTRKTPSLEIIASLAPDLIIADKTRHSAAYDTLSQIAPTIVLDSLGGDYHASVAQMAVIGEAIGQPEAMTARIAEHKATMTAFAERIRPHAAGVSAQFGVTNADGLYLHAPPSYNGALLAMFGFDSNMTPGEGGVYERNYIETTLEQLSEIDPDILILGEYTDPSATDTWAGEPLWQALTAVEGDAVHYVVANNWSRLRGMVAAELTAADLLKIVGADESGS